MEKILINFILLKSTIMLIEINKKEVIKELTFKD